jgi:hypothetical protein
MRYDDATIQEVFQELGTAYAVAKRLGLDHSSVSKRINRLGLRGVPTGTATRGRRYVVIPDTQVKPKIDLAYLRWIGEYIEDQQPDVVVCLGDFADMESLSSYDKGKRSFEGRRYKADIAAAREGMRVMMEPIKCNPELHLVLGNHENRIARAANDSPEFDGLLSVEDLGYESFGWKVYPFLHPVTLDGIVFCHYIVSGVMGRPITTANALLSKGHQTTIVGHQQGRQVAYARRSDGTMLTGIIAGSAYLHEEEYLGHQANIHWRGVIVLNEVSGGTFDEMFVSMDYLQRRFAA